MWYLLHSCRTGSTVSAMTQACSRVLWDHWATSSKSWLWEKTDQTVYRENPSAWISHGAFTGVKEWMGYYRVKACETEECLVRLVLICRMKKPGSRRRNAAQQWQDAAAVPSVWKNCVRTVHVSLYNYCTCFKIFNLCKNDSMTVAASVAALYT